MVLNESQNIISIVGPTCSGKSSLALNLCTKYNLDLISCDSMQIYKYMNIGTAKPSEHEQSIVRHHMIDIIEPNVNYSVSDYANDARSIYFSLRKEGKKALICGGTGLYLDAFLGKTNYVDDSSNSEIRNKLNEIYKEKGAKYLHSLLQKIDPASANAIHCNNVKRVIRALEIYKVTGMTKTEYDSLHKQNGDINCIYIGLDYDNRDILRERIYKRCDLMFSSGLIEEVDSLMKNNLLIDVSTASQGIGYKETIGYLKGEYDKETLIELVKNRTAQYAKRQLTWFRRNKDIHWFTMDNLSEKELIKKVDECVGGVTC